jgi:hypothetical protein
MTYYNSSLYIWSGSHIYKYELMNNVWIITRDKGTAQRNITANSLVVYKDSLYSIYGWDFVSSNGVAEIIKVNLSGDSYEVQSIHIKNDEIANWSHAYVIKNNLAYLFGGGGYDGYNNSLARLDLDNSNLGFKILSKFSEYPIARGGHGMEVYNDELYIFGGIDNNGNK